MPFLSPNQQCQSTEGRRGNSLIGRLYFCALYTVRSVWEIRKVAWSNIHRCTRTCTHTRLLFRSSWVTLGASQVLMPNPLVFQKLVTIFSTMKSERCTPTLCKWLTNRQTGRTLAHGRNFGRMPYLPPPAEIEPRLAGVLMPNPKPVFRKLVTIFSTMMLERCIPTVCKWLTNRQTAVVTAHFVQQLAASEFNVVDPCLRAQTRLPR